MIDTSISGKELTIKIKQKCGKVTTDSAVEAVLKSTDLIKESTMEMIYRFNYELSQQIPPPLYKCMKDVFIEEMLQMLSEHMNVDEYKEYLMKKDFRE